MLSKLLLLLLAACVVAATLLLLYRVCTFEGPRRAAADD